VSTPDRLLLRAELQWEDRAVVTRTERVSTTSLLLPVVQPPREGTRVRVRLSFPRLVAAFDVHGVVLRTIAPENPIELPIVEIGIDPNETTHKKLAALLAEGPPPSASDIDYKILIVEDNSMIRDMFSYGIHKYFKRRGGVSVDVAEDGAKAWAMLCEEKYDLAIVDHYLPVLEGSRLIAKIREDQRMATMPIVAVSVGGEEVREAAVHAGADLFLDKPVVLRDLFSTLDRLTTLQGDGR
jgi:CheY-like chemotaxis protein